MFDQQHVARFVGGLTLGAAVLLSGCEDGPSGPDGTTFQAELSTMNAQVAGSASGEAEFRIADGRFEATVDGAGLAREMLHPQHVHAAASCPPPSADENGDGFIDVVEGLPFYGAILIPLDGDLSSQSAGNPDGFPTAGASGEVGYSQSTDLQTMLSDLRAEDPKPDDPVVKLSGELSLPGRTVVLHGVPEGTDLPESVKSIAGLPAHLTLPVACGEVGASG